MINRIGATPIGVWIIKHLVSPIQQWVYRLTGGNRFLMGGTQDMILLLTTKGRRSGKDRTTPVFYLRDNDRLVICNVNPGFERTNPWVLNLRAHPVARAQIGQGTGEYHAREVTEAEMAYYWPQLLKLWPAYQSHFERSGRRAVFVLEPD
jgi:deazaflavin-dependent oxidoreductase (nitroreductase family)